MLLVIFNCRGGEGGRLTCPQLYTRLPCLNKPNHMEFLSLKWSYNSVNRTEGILILTWFIGGGLKFIVPYNMKNFKLPHWLIEVWNIMRKHPCSKCIWCEFSKYDLKLFFCKSILFWEPWTKLILREKCFPTFELNIQSEGAEIRTRKTPNTEHLQTVLVSPVSLITCSILYYNNLILIDGRFLFASFYVT